MTRGARSGDFYGFAPHPDVKPSRVSGRARSPARMLSLMVLLTIATAKAVYAAVAQQATPWQMAVVLWAVVAMAAWYLLETEPEP